MAGGSMYLPATSRHLEVLSIMEYITQFESRTSLPRWCVRQCNGVPFVNGLGKSWRRECACAGEYFLKQCIATAMVAMQMGIQNMSQRALTKRGLNQRKRLAGMAVITRVNQDGLLVV